MVELPPGAVACRARSEAPPASRRAVGQRDRGYPRLLPHRQRDPAQDDLLGIALDAVEDAPVDPGHGSHTRGAAPVEIREQLESAREPLAVTRGFEADHLAQRL